MEWKSITFTLNNFIMNKNKDKNRNKKRIKDIMIFIFSIICLISISFISTSEININEIKEKSNSKERNLQYSSESIYYELKYPINNITGTGDRLKDVPYNVICKIMQCIPCCKGDIDKMVCGGPDECNTYKNDKKKPNLLISIILPIGIFIIFLIIFSTFLIVYKYSFGYSILFTLAFMTIFLIPYFAYLAYKKSKEIENKEKIKKK
jgi:hypothetical protein